MSLYEVVQNIARIFVLFLLAGLLAIFVISASSLSFNTFELRAHSYETRIVKLQEQNQLTNEKLVEVFGPSTNTWMKITIKNADNTILDTVLYEQKEVTYADRELFASRSNYNKYSETRLVGGKILEINIISQ